MNTSDTTIGNWENNVSEPRISQFRQLAAFFDVPMESIEIDVVPKKRRRPIVRHLSVTSRPASGCFITRSG